MTSHRWGSCLLEVASNELVAAQEQMLLLGRKTARERLASFLLAQSRQGMPCGHARQRFRLPMTRVDIADYLGLTIETVSRTLTRLRAEGLIDIVSQSGLVISDPSGWRTWRAGCTDSEGRSARGRTRTGKEFPPGVFETPAVTISPLAHGERPVAPGYAIGTTGRNLLGTKLEASANGAPLATVQPA